MLRLGLGGLLVVALSAGVASAQDAPSAPQEKQKDAWRGVHIMSPGHDGVPLLKRAIDEALKPMGVNVLVLEVNYHFDFAAHPELSDSSRLSRDDARELAAFCHERGIRLIPQFNCLGHQSWNTNGIFPLLKQYPQFDETPDWPKDKKMYCRSWCPSHPALWPIVYSLIDELTDAFEADAVHVGMDEVFLIADPECPRCRGKTTADLFAVAVNKLHDHIVGEKKLTMLMWSDRLLDDKVMHYGEWESSRNGTSAAIDQIPKDIIMCDWHYEMREHYPSVAYFQEKGFRVWPSTWKDPKAAVAMLEDARKGATDRMIGHLGTTWMGTSEICKALIEPDAKVSASARGAAESLRACMERLKEARAD